MFYTKTFKMISVISIKVMITIVKLQISLKGCKID